MTTTTDMERHGGNGLVAPARSAIAPALITDEHRDILRSMIDRNATPAQVEMLIVVGNRYGLDPLMGHVVLISGKCFVTHKGLMHKAHASGQFDGIETAYGVDDLGEWCECRVFRKDMGRPFTGRIYTQEYKGNNPVWKTYPRAMAAKTAESFVLRRAFDVSLTSQEEMVTADAPGVDHPRALPSLDPGEDRRITRDGTPRAERTPVQERFAPPQERSQPPAQPVHGRPTDGPGLSCEECGRTLTRGQASVSFNKFGRELCPMHQRPPFCDPATPAPHPGFDADNRDGFVPGETDPFAADGYGGPALMDVPQDETVPTGIKG